MATVVGYICHQPLSDDPSQASPRIRTVDFAFASQPVVLKSEADAELDAANARADKAEARYRAVMDYMLQVADASVAFTDNYRTELKQLQQEAGQRALLEERKKY